MKRKKWFIFLIMISALFLATGCSSDDDDPPASQTGETTSSGTVSCNCTPPEEIIKNGLAFIFEKQVVKKPSNVSIFFKMETQSGQSVTGLETDDFRLTDAGEEMSSDESEAKWQISLQTHDVSQNTLLLLDLSGSVLENSTKLANLKESAVNMVQTLLNNNNQDYAENRMAVYWFDGAAEIHLLSDFTDKADTLRDAVSSLPNNIESKDSSSNLFGAVIKSIDTLEDTVQRVSSDLKAKGSVIIFTDGDDEAGRATEEEALKAVENASGEVGVYTIGLGDEIDRVLLSKMGKDGSENAVNVDDLAETFEKIALEVQKDQQAQYLLEYCSPRREGKQNLSLEVNAGYTDEISGAFLNGSSTLKTCYCSDGFEGGCNWSNF